MTGGITKRPTRYDPKQRRTAAHLNKSHPSWLVLWGVHSRVFWAYPLFRAPAGTIVWSDAPGDLVVQMRQAEMAAQNGPPPLR